MNFVSAPTSNLIGIYGSSWTVNQHSRELVEHLGIHRAPSYFGDMFATWEHAAMSIHGRGPSVLLRLPSELRIPEECPIPGTRIYLARFDDIRRHGIRIEQHAVSSVAFEVPAVMFDKLDYAPCYMYMANEEMRVRLAYDDKVKPHFSGVGDVSRRDEQGYVVTNDLIAFPSMKAAQAGARLVLERLSASAARSLVA